MSEIQEPAASGRAWRQSRQKPIMLRLPFCGRLVQIQHVQLDRLLISGKVPDFLTPLVADAIWTQMQQGDKTEDDIEADKNYFALVELVAKAALVNPRVVEHPTEEDEIAISDLEFGDKMLLYTIAKQPLEVLHSFRYEQAPDVEPVPQGENLQPAPEPAAAHRE